MTDELRIALHDPAGPAPAGWTEFVTREGLPGVFDWSMVRAVASTGQAAVVAATVCDGAVVRGLVTGRFNGPRPRRGVTPLAGVIDVDNLVSGSVPGLVVEAGAPELRIPAIHALREAIRERYGLRVQALLFRQLTADALPAVLRWPAIVREGGPLAVFTNRFDHEQAYLASLTKNRRKLLRQTNNHIAADPELVMAHTGAAAAAGPLTPEAVCALNAQVVERNHHRRFLRKRFMHPEVARAMLGHPDVRRVTYHDSCDRLVAYLLVWDHPQVPIAGAWGRLELADGDRKNLWLHSHVELIRWCIASGRQELIWGQGSLSDKLRLGSQPRRQWAALVPQAHLP